MPQHLSKQVHDPDQAFFGHPKPLKGLFFTELWERFSYYGIRPLLILYMAALVADGGLGLDRPTASAIVGLFAGSMYLMTLLGGWVADNYLGQERAVWYGSLIIAFGHLSIALAALFGHFFFYFGLVLIVIGSGLFKTCISVIVGTLYQAQDSRRDAGFSIFYMGINLGSLIAPLLTGLLVKEHGWHWGFGIGGVGMLIALLIFKLITVPQLKQFNHVQGNENNWARPVHYNPKAPQMIIGFIAVVGLIIGLVSLGIININPIQIATYFTITICICIALYFSYLLLFAGLNNTEKKQIIICFILLITAALFWSAFEQKPTSFNLFAQDFTDRQFFGFEIPAVWFQSINPLFIIIFAPIIAWLWVKLGKQNLDPSYITKFIIALLLAAGGFLVMSIASYLITQNGGTVSALWIASSLLLLTLGELCLSPVGLSTMTKLAPTIIRGQVMGLWFTASALGNLMAGLIGGHVSIHEVDQLPLLFVRCVIALLLGALVLWLMRKLIRKLLNQTSTPSQKSIDMQLEKV